MKISKPKATATVYQVNIDMESFDIITAWEASCPVEVNTLAEVLETNSSACDVDYSGLFGVAIFLTLETENDRPEEWENIQYIIKEWVERAENLCNIYNITID